MQSILLITRKNLKLLLRSKWSALIVFFAPLLMILVLGLAYNTSTQYSLNVGVIAPEAAEDVNAVLNTLREEGFRVIPYQDAEECISDIKVSAVHACLSLPGNFQIENNQPKEITFHIDPSKINLVWMIQETLKTHLNFKAQEISQSLSQDLLSRLSDTKSKVNERLGTVSALQEQSSSAGSSVSSAQQGLSGVDTLSPTTTFDLSIMQNASDELQSALGAIGTAQEELENANISSAARAAIEDSLGTAESRLAAAQAVVSGSGAGSISQLIADIQADLEIAKGKLDAAAEVISSSSSNLGSASGTLQEISSGLASLRSTLESIQSNLEGQKVTEAGTIAAPITTRIEKVAREASYLNYSFPTLLVLVVMFTSLILGTILVMMEKNSPAFLRNYFLPVRKATFVISTYLTTLILIVVQILILLGISLLFLTAEPGTIALTVLVLFIAASVFTFLGMALGYLFVSEETGILASISAGSILLFLSGVVLPLEVISPELREIATFNPFVLAEKIIRELFIFNAPITAVGMDLAILIGYGLVLFLLIVVVELLLHQRLSHRFLRHHHKMLREKDKMNRNEA